MGDVCVLAHLERHRLTLVEKVKKGIEVDEFQAWECEELWDLVYSGDGRNSNPEAYHNHM